MQIKLCSPLTSCLAARFLAGHGWSPSWARGLGTTNFLRRFSHMHLPRKRRRVGFSKLQGLSELPLKMSSGGRAPSTRQRAASCSVAWGLVTSYLSP